MNSKPHSDIDRAELCEREVGLEMEHESAVAHVRSTLEENRLQVITEFPISDQNGSVPGDVTGPYTIIKFTVSDTAIQAFEVVNPRFGVLFPSTVLVWEEHPGNQRVYYLDTMRLAPELSLVTDVNTWANYVNNAEELVYNAFDSLDSTIDYQ